MLFRVVLFLAGVAFGHAAAAQPSQLPQPAPPRPSQPAQPLPTQPPPPRTISGLVSSEEYGGALEGVVVVAKGSGMISGSQLDGMYYIPVTTRDTVLVFSREDLAPVEIKLTDSCSYYCIKLRQKAGGQHYLSIEPITIILSKNEYLHYESKDQQRESGRL